MSNYQVIVGNIGLVHESNRCVEARGIYGEYVRQSRQGYGRAAGEAVALFKDDEPVLEYEPFDVYEEVEA